MIDKESAQNFLKTPLRPGAVFEPMLEVQKFDPKKMWRIAKVMVDDSLHVQEGDRLLIKLNPGGRQLASMLAYQAAQKGAAVIHRVEDQTVEAALLAGMEGHITPAVFEEMAAVTNAEITWSTKVAFVRCVDDPNARRIVDGNILNLWNQALEPSLDVRVERRDWTLIYMPTPAEAQLDGMPYEECVQMFLDGCDRQWRKIKTAQQVLIDENLNPGERLEIHAGEDLDKRWQTHVAMSIINQTFANSTVDKNVPGSEVFSSPVRGTIEGVWAIPYPVMFNGLALRNLILVFKDGKVVEHYTDEPGGMDWVEKQLSVDEGAREVGEVALGTNRAFDRPLLNGLFVEKVGGSSHLAIGRAYELRTYNGLPVKLDNGVRSANHIDLTRLMLPNYGGGRVLVDGKLIQQNGDFLDPRLAILNAK